MRERLEALVLEMHRHGILYTEAVREFKKVFICTVLRANNDNQVKSARQMGLHRNTLRRTIFELHIDIASVRPSGLRRPPRPERQILTPKKEHLS